jgi:SnoaL-like domain
MIRRKKGEAMTARSNGTIGATAEATWAVEHFARFWANPDPTKPTGRLAKDIIGRWPDGLTLRGIDEYMGRLITIGTLIPDIRLEVVEHAVNGNFAFIRWRAVGTGRKGPFEMYGVDRLCVDGDQIKENIVHFDTATFEDLVGAPLSSI